MPASSADTTPPPRILPRGRLRTPLDKGGGPRRGYGPPNPEPISPLDAPRPTGALPPISNFQIPISLLRLLPALPLLLLCTGCLTWGFARQYPGVTDYSNGQRQVRFVAMHHIGLPAYYAHTADIIRAAKTDGYVLYYEQVRVAGLSDRDLRKLRAIVGFYPSPEVYEAEFAKRLGPQFVAQDTRQFLGLVTPYDVHADIHARDFIRAYEDRYGPVPLGPDDTTLPLEEPVRRSLWWGRGRYVIITYRDQHLARLVHDSSSPRIIILYGAAHRPGFLRALRRLDPTWRQVD